MLVLPGHRRFELLAGGVAGADGNLCGARDPQVECRAVTAREVRVPDLTFFVRFEPADGARVGEHAALDPDVDVDERLAGAVFNSDERWGRDVYADERVALAGRAYCNVRIDA